MNTPVYAYTRTPYLIENLARLDFLRKDVHALILPRHTELHLRWDAQALRTFYAFSLYDLSLQRGKIIEYLSRDHAYSKQGSLNALTRFRKALQHVEYSWFATLRRLEYDDFKELYRSVWSGAFPVPREEFLGTAIFLAERETDPVISALTMFLFLYRYHPDAKTALPFAHLGFYTLLVRAGWDFRGIVVFEEFLHGERAYFKEQLRRSIDAGNATGWLEYATNGFASVAEKVLESYSLTSSSEGRPAEFFHLSDRQKQILALLDEPQSVLSNKKVQHVCGISQITASRELAKLVELGLVFPTGKGRATMYVRARAR